MHSTLLVLCDEHGKHGIWSATNQQVVYRHCGGFVGWVAGEQVGIRPTAASAVTGRRGGGGGSCCAIFVRVRAARGQSATKKLILRLLKSGKIDFTTAKELGYPLHLHQ